MGKTQVSEKDKPDLDRLEAIVKKHQKIGTAALSSESGINPTRIRDLLNNHSYRAIKETDPNSPAGTNLAADLWVYKQTMEDIARPHRAKK
jgi:hypothetical protein